MEELESEFQRLLALAEQAENQPGLWQTMVTQWESLIEKAEKFEDATVLTELKGNLANTCVRVYEITGNEQWAERASKLYDDVLQVFTRSLHPETWAITQHALGYMFFLRFEFSGDENRAQVAENYYRAAIETIDQGNDPDDWAMVQHSLGNLLLSRYEHYGDESIARNCENCCVNALRIYEREIALLDWALEHHLLGTLYSVRFERSWDDGDARSAQDHYDKALKEFRLDISPLNWAMVQHSLGNLFLGRYERSRSKSDGVASGEHYQNALKVYHREYDPSHWAGTQYALANLLAHRYEESKDSGDADASENHYRNALLEYQRDTVPAFWALVQHALGNLQYLRYEIQGSDEYAQAAERHYKNALGEFHKEMAPAHWATVQHGLGSLFSLLYERHGQNVYAQTAREYLLAIQEHALSSGLPPIFSYKANASLTRLSFNQGNWVETTRTYMLTQETLQVLLALQTLRSGKETWLAEAYGLASVAAYAFAQLGKYEDAIVAFEAGRTHLLRETLEQNRRDLLRLVDSGHKDLLDRFERAAEEINRLSEMKNKLPNNWINRLQSSRSELNQAIHTIQEIPEFRNFMKPPSFVQIAEVAKEYPLVYLLATSSGGLAMIVTGSNIRAVPLNHVNEDLVKAWLIKEKDGKPAGGYLHGQIGNVQVGPELNNILVSIGARIIGPIIPALQELDLKNLTFIPSGLLALFPFHAASYTINEKQYMFLDEYTSSYAPSALILGWLNKNMVSHSKEIRRLLVIGNPMPLPQDYQSLRFAQLEAEQVAKSFAGQSQFLCETDATLDAVEKNIDSASYLHFACHGEFDHLNPLNSGLILRHGERLTLNDLLGRLKLCEYTRLVVLSACKTALTDFSKLPDEALGLPGGFLFAGALGVVGTLWPVEDLSTVLLMIRFYQYLFQNDLHRGGESISPPEALRNAQRWLKDVKAKELKDYVKSFRLEYLTESTSTAINEVYKRLMFEEDDSQPYTHPYYWAGYTFHGI